MENGTHAVEIPWEKALFHLKIISSPKISLNTVIKNTSYQVNSIDLFFNICYKFI